MSEKTRNWLKVAGIRAVKTMAQTAVAMLPAAATIGAVEIFVGDDQIKPLSWRGKQPL